MTRVRSPTDPIDDALRRRFAQVAAYAHEALGIPPDAIAGSDDERATALISAVESRLAAAAGASWREAADAHRSQMERLQRRYDTRFSALERVGVAIAQLREMTGPAAMLGRAPKELCLGSRFDRVVLSLIRDGQLVAEAAHFRDDDAGAAAALEALATDPPRLEHPLIEIELLRRHRASIVTDADAHPRVHASSARTMAWRTYAAAPISVRGEVIGAIHADAGTSDRSLDVLDGDVLWSFAVGLAEAYETAFLRRSLRNQRTEMRDFVDWLAARSMELSDGSIELASNGEQPPDPPGRLGAVAAGAAVDDRIVFGDLLTRRELDVLRLLARGETNARIAADLVISTTTVKFHVVNILRKLHVGNRAEAVSRYHRLLHVGGRQDA